jgi:HK97 family phage major capsid protein
MLNLVEKRDSLSKQMQGILDKATKEKRNVSAQEAYNFDKLDHELDEVMSMLEIRQRYERLSKEDTAYRDAFNAYVEGTATVKQRNLLEEKRALSVVTGTAGGYTVPQAWAADIFAALPQWDSVRQSATVVSTATGAPFYLPVSDDSSNAAELISENTAFSSNADPTFSQITLNAYKYSSKLIIVARELLQDSQYSVSKYLAGVLAKRVGRLQQTHFTNGDNTNKPQGIVGAASVGKVGLIGQTTSVTYDDLVDLIFSVAPAYRQNSKFMMNDATIKALMKLKDSNGQPIFEDGKILGYDIVPNNDMSNMAANAK